MKIQVLLIFLFTSSITSAQIGDSLLMNEVVNNINIFDMEIVRAQNPLSIGIRQIDLSYEGVKGTPWLFEQQQMAEMIIDNEKKLVQTQAAIYLDIYKHEVLAVLPNDQLYTLTGTQVKDITFVDQQRKFRAYNKKKLNERAEPYVFAEVLHEGKITLVKVVDKKLRKADYNDSYGNTGTRYDEFLKEERHWIAKGDDSFEKIKLKKKSLLKLFPEYESQLKKIFKDQKITILDERSLIAVLQQLEN